MLKLILALVAVSALAADIEAPIISLNLAHGSESSAAHASSSNFADECCNGYSCDNDGTDACTAPEASAYDHHDGDISTQIRTEYTIFVASYPGSDPEQVTNGDLCFDQTTQAVDPNCDAKQQFDNMLLPDSNDYVKFRGEFVLNYDVDDSAGNSAETITYALIMRDTIPPTYEGTDETQTSTYGAAASTFNTIPLSFFEDAYDGSFVSVTFTDDLGAETTLTSSATTPNAVGAFPVPTKVLEGDYLCYTTTVTAVATDYADIFGESNEDNANTFTFDFTLTDTTPPTINMPSNEAEMIGTSSGSTECDDQDYLLAGNDKVQGVYPYTADTATGTDESCNCLAPMGNTELGSGAGACKMSCTTAYTFGLTSTSVGSVVVTCQAEDFQTRTASLDSSAIIIVDTTKPELLLGKDALTGHTDERADGADGATYTAYYNITASDNFEHSSTIQHSAGYLNDATDIENLKDFYTCTDTCTPSADLVVTQTWHKAVTAADTCDTFDDVTNDISIVDVGTYVLKYVCTDQSGNTDFKCRTVLNQDHTIPILNFIAEGNNLGPCSNDCTGVASGTGNYVDEGATCSDTVDGVISELVEVSGDVVSLAVIGTYHITYDCTDSAGNEATSITRTVNVYDDVCPTCAIETGFEVIIEASFPYTDDAVTCTDNLDFPTSAALTQPATVTGEVDVELTGNYTLTYHATDGAGNTNFNKHAATFGTGDACNDDLHQHRTVVVQDTLKPIIYLKDQMLLMEESTSVNGWIIGAIASSVAGIAIVGFAATRKTQVATSVPV